MKRYVKIAGGVALACVFGLGSFLAGWVMGQNNLREFFHRAAYQMESLNSVARFADYAEISREISNGNSGAAQCSANRRASSELRQVRICLADKSCRDTVHDAVTNQAPEILEIDHAEAAYFDNIDRCSATNPDGRGIEPPAAPCKIKRPKCRTDDDEGRL